MIEIQFSVTPFKVRKFAGWCRVFPFYKENELRIVSAMVSDDGLVMFQIDEGDGFIIGASTFGVALEAVSVLMPNAREIAPTGDMRRVTWLSRCLIRSGPESPLMADYGDGAKKAVADWFPLLTSGIVNKADLIVQAEAEGIGEVTETEFYDFLRGRDIEELT